MSTFADIWVVIIIVVSLHKELGTFNYIHNPVIFKVVLTYTLSNEIIKIWLSSRFQPILKQCHQQRSNVLK